MLVLIYPDADDEATLVLTVRPEGDLRHAGQVSLPGGAADPGDDFPDGTALREAAEEVGLDAESRPACRIVGRLDVVDVRVSGFLLVPVVALAERAPVLTPDPREVAAILHVPVGRFLPDAADRDRRGGAGRLAAALRRLPGRRAPRLGCHGAGPRAAGRGARGRDRGDELSRRPGRDRLPGLALRPIVLLGRRVGPDQHPLGG